MFHPTTPTRIEDFDLYFSRGHGVDDLPGNQFYRQLIRQYAKAYTEMIDDDDMSAGRSAPHSNKDQSSAKSKKTKIVKDIISIMVKKGSRFYSFAPTTIESEDDDNRRRSTNDDHHDNKDGDQKEERGDNIISNHDDVNSSSTTSIANHFQGSNNFHQQQQGEQGQEIHHKNVQQTPKQSKRQRASSFSSCCDEKHHTSSTPPPSSKKKKNNPKQQQHMSPHSRVPRPKEGMYWKEIEPTSKLLFTKVRQSLRDSSKQARTSPPRSRLCRHRGGGWAKFDNATPSSIDAASIMSEDLLPSPKKSDRFLDSNFPSPIKSATVFDWDEESMICSKLKLTENFENI